MGASEKMDRLQSVAVQNKRRTRRGNIRSVSHLQKRDECRKAKRRSAVARKRAAANVGPKPTNVKTFAKEKHGHGRFGLMSVVGIALKGFGKALRKVEKKADTISEKMIKEMNSPKPTEKAKGYTKLVGGTLAASAAMPSTVKKTRSKN